MQLNVGDIVHAEVRKADLKQEAGLKLYENRGNIYVRKVDGLFKRRQVPLQQHDRIHTLNGVDVEDYTGGLNEMMAVIKRELKVWIKFERIDEPPPDESEEEEEEEELLMIEGGEELLQLENEQEEEDDEESDEEDLLNLTNGPTNPSEGDVAPGMEMRLFKLKAKPKMNGTIVKILKSAGKPGRWQVKLLRHPLREVSAGAVMSVAEENLKEL
jgi:hypothetical protein